MNEDFSEPFQLDQEPFPPEDAPAIEWELGDEKHRSLLDSFKATKKVRNVLD